MASRIIQLVIIACGIGLLPDLAHALDQEQRGRDFLAAVSEPPRDDYAVFIEQNFDPSLVERRGVDDLQDMMKMLADNHQKLTVHEAVENGQGLTYTVQDADGMWLRITLAFGPGPDHRIAGFGAQMIPVPATERGPRVAEQEWLKQFAAYMNDRDRDDEFSGAVLIARGDDILYADAFGFADRERKTPNTLDTPINLGSMNKMFTAVAVAQLVQAGKLTFGSRVGDYLPDYPNTTVRDKVTLHQLLTHTSGLGSYWNDRYLARKDRLVSLSQFAELFQNEPLQFEPGERFHYSNNGPVVLGLIIEAVSGQDYYGYVREHIYEPAGMTHSGHYQIDDLDAEFATGYERNPETGAWQSNTDTMGRRGSAGGGGYASARDMLKFSRALMTSRLVSAELVQTLMTGKVLMGEGLRYAYGFGDHQLEGQRFVGHNGGAPGISAEFSIFPDLGYTVIVLSNFGRAAMPVANKARSLIAVNN